MMVSTALRFMAVRLLAGCMDRTIGAVRIASQLVETSLRRPGLVVAGGASARPAFQHRAGRAIGGRRASQIRLMRLLPGINRLVGVDRHLVGRMVQPAVPYRRHTRRVLVAAIDHPAAFAAFAPAAALQRPMAAFAVVAVAERVGADELALEPGEDACADGHCRPETTRNIRQRRRKTRATMAPHRVRVQATRPWTRGAAIDNASCRVAMRAGKCNSRCKRLKLRPSTCVPIVTGRTELSLR